MIDDELKHHFFNKGIVADKDNNIGIIKDDSNNSDLNMQDLAN